MENTTTEGFQVGGGERREGAGCPGKWNNHRRGAVPGTRGGDVMNGMCASLKQWEEGRVWSSYSVRQG